MDLYDTLFADTSQKPKHTEEQFLHMKSIFEQLGAHIVKKKGILSQI